MRSLVPTEVQVDGVPVPMLAYVEAVARSLPGATAAVLLDVTCPWVVLALGEARRKSAHELLADVHDAALHWAAPDYVVDHYMKSPLTCGNVTLKKSDTPPG